MNALHGAWRPTRRATLALALAAALAAPLPALAQARFATADAAGDALIEAVDAADGTALARLLGKGWRLLLPDTLNSPDARRFVEKAREKHRVAIDGQRAELRVGADDWALPIPLAQGSDGQWRFDTRGGREAMLDRQLGNNERSAIQATLAYVDAQREYALADRNGDGVLEYAQKLISSPGQRDGLIWPASLGDDSPLGEAYLPRTAGRAYHGYRFRILTAQGEQAPGGARSYLIGPRMVSGYALLAWPVRYGTSGVMSFMVNQAGVVHERDLGPGTAQAAAAIQAYNPGEGWKPVQP